MLKSELAIRPIWHRVDRREEAHILIAFLGYCLWVYLKQNLRPFAAPVLCKYSDDVGVFGFRRFPTSTDLASAKLD